MFFSFVSVLPLQVALQTLWRFQEHAAPFTSQIVSFLKHAHCETRAYALLALSGVGEQASVYMEETAFPPRVVWT